MRLFHVSEEQDILAFVPRVPERKDMDGSKPLVWAITEECLQNYLLPRDCPRVAYRAVDATSREDAERFFSCAGARRVVAIERGWLEAARVSPLCVYEFDPGGFALQDEVAGYYVSERAPAVIGRRIIASPLGELLTLGVEIRVLPELWSLADAVRASTLAWSLIRMRNALPRNGP